MLEASSLRMVVGFVFREEDYLPKAIDVSRCEKVS